MSELAKALLAFQKDAPSLERTAEGQVRGRTAYKYVSLDSAMAVIRPKLNEYGIVVTQRVNGISHERVLETALIHAESGEERASQLRLPDTDDMQTLGSAITYARRYSLVAMLGLVADEDDDGVRSVAQRQQPAHAPTPSGAPAAEPFPVSMPETLPPRATDGQKGEFRDLVEQLYLQDKRSPTGSTWTEFALAFAQDQLGVRSWHELKANKAQYQTVIEFLRPFLKEPVYAEQGNG